MEKASGRAVSKVILAGEHFVVHGCPALATPLTGLTLQVTLQKSQTFSPQDPLVEFGLTICKNHFGGPGKKLDISISSQIPSAGGMGSSAALSVAITRAYTNLMEIKLTPKQTYQISMEIETKAHGKPSGIDSTVVTYERPVSFLRGQEPTFLQTAEKVGLVVLDTKTPSHTRKMVQGVSRFKENHPKKFDLIFQRACSLVEAFSRALREGHSKALGELAEENHQLLRQVGVFSEATDRACESALKSGALGAKMSGGGGGGVILAFTKPESITGLVEKLQQGPWPVLTWTVV